MLLSQDPSDFEGQSDGFTTQLGAVIAFACAQTQRGLGVAFVKLPGRSPERIRCWQPESA